MRQLTHFADPENGKNGFPLAGDRQLRLALQLGNLSTWTWNLETGEVDWSRDAEAQKGYVPERFGRTLEAYLDVVHPDDVARVRETLLRAAETETGFEIEFRIVLPDGTIRWRTAAADVFPDHTAVLVGEQALQIGSERAARLGRVPAETGEDGLTSENVAG